MSARKKRLPGLSAAVFVQGAMLHLLRIDGLFM
jgi:hypothetical protein